MTTYLLHGGMVRDKNESNDSYFTKIAEAIPPGGTALIVLFASEEMRWPEQVENMKALITARAGGKAINFVCATREHFVEEVVAADAILMRGGSTNKLLEALRAYALTKESFEGKLVTGSSAGAYALAQFGYDKSHKAVRAGLGLVPVRALCHYLSENLEERTDEVSLKVMQTSHPELELVVLKECEWKEFTI